MTPRIRRMLAPALVILAGCNEMKEQPKYDPLAPSTLFADGRSARPLMADTVSRGNLPLDSLLYTGKINGKPADIFPFPVTAEVLARGRERFEIFCAVCHGRLGDGQGMVVKRGFKTPPSYHIERLQKSPPGYFFDVMTNGFGVMYSYGDRIPVRDRWAIAAYIRALQLSQSADVANLPDLDRAELEKLK